jgi:hypothetical protein
MVTVKLVPIEIYVWIGRNLEGRYVVVPTTDPNHLFVGFKHDKTIYVADYRLTGLYGPDGKYGHISIPGAK